MYPVVCRCCRIGPSSLWCVSEEGVFRPGTKITFIFMTTYQFFCIENIWEALSSIVLPITYLNQRAPHAVLLLLPCYLPKFVLLENPFVLCNTMIHVNFQVSVFGFIDWMVKNPTGSFSYYLKGRPRGYGKIYWDIGVWYHIV